MWFLFQIAIMTLESLGAQGRRLAVAFLAAFAASLKCGTSGMEAAISSDLQFNRANQPHAHRCRVYRRR